MKKKFNIHNHKAILIQILRDIFTDVELRTLLGFKGGTAAMLFYDLDRMSVDLDFNLLDREKEDLVMQKLPKILIKYGKILDSRKKRFTLFFLVDYGKGDKKVKIEISRRKSIAKFKPMDYLGLTVPVMVKEDTLAHKISALITRKGFASRDMYDINFFLKQHWDINEKVIKEQTGMGLKKALKEAIKRVSNVKKRDVLKGLGELVQDGEKDSLRGKLKDETIFNLKLYLSQIE